MSRIIIGIDVLDRLRPIAVKLQDRFALTPNKMLHASAPEAVRTGVHDIGSLRIKFVAHADVECAGDNRDTLSLGYSEAGESNSAMGMTGAITDPSDVCWDSSYA